MPLELQPQCSRKVINHQVINTWQYQQQAWNTGRTRASRCPQWPHVQKKSIRSRQLACLPDNLFVRVIFFVQSNSTVAAPPPGPRWDTVTVPQSAANNKSEAQNFCLLLMEPTFCWLPLRCRPCDAAPSPRCLLTNRTRSELQPEQQMPWLAVRTALFPSM